MNEGPRGQAAPGERGERTLTHEVCNSSFISRVILADRSLACESLFITCCAHRADGQYSELPVQLVASSKRCFLGS